MKKLAFLPVFIFLLPILFSCKKETSWNVISPNNKVSFNLELNEGRLFYFVNYISSDQQTVVLEKSELGLVRNDASFAERLTFKGQTEPRNVSESFDLFSGKKKSIDYEGIEKIVSFENQNGQVLQVVIRAQNEGVAFKYILPWNDETEYTIEQEITSFNVPDEGKAWIAPYDTVAPWAPAYETAYTNGLPVGTPAPENKNGWAFPALFNTNNLWVLISEAGVYGNYCGLHLEQNCEEGIYRVRFPEADENQGAFPQNPSSILPWEMPWKVIIVGESLQTIVESNLIPSLAKPNKFKETSWVKPGRASWSWWGEDRSSGDFEIQKQYVDFSSGMGWEYVLVDAGWQNMQGGDIGRLAEYAAPKNVGILVWYNSGMRPSNSGRGPGRASLRDRQVRLEEFQKLKEWGVKGIKVDFFDSDAQGVIKYYNELLNDAFEYNLLVNFHGSTLPTGWRRTWPNLMTMEAIRGAETYRYGADYPESAPWLNTIVPFTRNVVGPMDYTPVTFSDRRYPHLTTMAHELALSVVFESGVMHFADKYRSYLSLPDFALDFLKEVPNVWDDIKLIDGYPGEFIVIARKKGNVWYLAAINGESEPKEVSVDLSFLSDGEHNLTAISDANGGLEQSSKSVTSQSSETLILIPRGGVCAVIE